MSADAREYGYTFEGACQGPRASGTIPAECPCFFLTRSRGGERCSPGAGRVPFSESCRPPPGRPIIPIRVRRDTSARRGHLGRDRGRRAGVGAGPSPARRVPGRPDLPVQLHLRQFDIYHVNDFMRERGWRFNGQQYPNALHMAVTRPQTQPGWPKPSPPTWPRPWSTRATRRRAPEVGGHLRRCGRGMTDEADEFIKMVMSDMMDSQQAIPDGV